jgi:hypothetical protein
MRERSQSRRDAAGHGGVDSSSRAEVARDRMIASVSLELQNLAPQTVVMASGRIWHQAG